MNIRLTYPDKTAVIVTPGERTADFAVAVTERDGVTAVSLTPLREGLSLASVECELPVPAFLTGSFDNVYVYDNNAHTNDWTGVTACKPGEPVSGAELLVFKKVDTGDVFLCGFVTALRFWSRIVVKDGTVTFSFDMEERVLTAGETYTMERFMTTGGVSNEFALLETYADRVAEYMHAIPTGDLPVGWCSWSCYYSDVTEEKIRRAADGQVRYTKPGQANLIQIDDGWQKSGSFPGIYVTDESKFPEGMAATAKYVTDRGMVFGLWLAPFLLSDQSEFYEELKPLSLETVTLGEHFHPFDLGDPRYHEHLRRVFRRMTEEYGARYFKLDFLAASIRYFLADKGGHIRFKDGFCVECLRRALTVVRETVGPDVFMISCGAPTLAGVGLLNGARMSTDIIWGKSPDFPTYWSIMKDCIRTISCRGFFNRKVFVNDPDGLVSRDVDQGDGFNCTWSEAELWSIAVAMSGGSVLSNDELENLSPARRRLYTRLLPPLGKSGHPVDLFEQPEPTAHVLDWDGDVKFLALCNLGDKMKDVTLDLSKIGMSGALAVDCMSGKVIGITDTITVKNADPHSGAMFLLRKPAGKPAFAFADCDVYGGVHRVSVTFEDGKPVVTRPADAPDARVYLICPEADAIGKPVWSGKGYAVTEI